MKDKLETVIERLSKTNEKQKTIFSSCKHSQTERAQSWLSVNNLFSQIILSQYVRTWMTVFLIEFVYFVLYFGLDFRDCLRVFHTKNTERKANENPENWTFIKVCIKFDRNLVIPIKVNEEFSIAGDVYIIKQLFHSISSYMSCYQLMYDSISWNNC